ncbi:LysM peptidoglycan-binding domain-containing protein [Winogradskyella sp. MH6]|uniref:LysM peptidoglycan-binding domain-containing protein n=1 Tax=Winogradskyella sp. MH6 TaxID=2929510 RepID=UPI001FB21390|nr:LysM peptidoglycan-binding domain-containing protein [Winogradskyella sp. MH6]
MLKSFKLVFTISIALLSWLNCFSQEEGQYKDVILDGKPAKLNVITGEITLVNSDTETVIVTTDSLTKQYNNELKESSVIQIEAEYHTVKENETLLEIANKYNTTLTALKEANNLETTLVDAGQKLRVSNFEAQPESTLKIEEVEDSTVTVSSENNSGIHIVENGDTLYSLSKRYGFTVDELKTKNGLTSNLIKVGQELNVSHSDYKNSSTNKSFWTVSKGDTLYNISKRNGLTVDELKSLNGLTDNLILVGQTLKLK